MKNQTLHQIKGSRSGPVTDFAGKPEHKSLAADRLRAESPDKVSSRYAAVSHETCEQCDQGTVYNDCTCGARDTFDDPAEANCVCTNLEPFDCEECDGSGEVPVEDPKGSLIEGFIAALDGTRSPSSWVYAREEVVIDDGQFPVIAEFKVFKNPRKLYGPEVLIRVKGNRGEAAEVRIADLTTITEIARDVESIARINAKAVTA